VAEIDTLVGPREILLVNTGHKLGPGRAYEAAHWLAERTRGEAHPTVLRKPHRQYRVDSLSEPTIFVKVTKPPEFSGGMMQEPDLRKAQDEMEIASAV
jgi:hypothetical protein